MKSLPGRTDPTISRRMFSRRQKSKDPRHPDTPYCPIDQLCAIPCGVSMYVCMYLAINMHFTAFNYVPFFNEFFLPLKACMVNSYKGVSSQYYSKTLLHGTPH